MNRTFILICLASALVQQSLSCSTNHGSCTVDSNCCAGFQCNLRGDFASVVNGPGGYCGPIGSAGSIFSNSWYRIVTMVFMSVMSAYMRMLNG